MGEGRHRSGAAPSSCRRSVRGPFLAGGEAYLGHRVVRLVGGIGESLGGPRTVRVGGHCLERLHETLVCLDSVCHVLSFHVSPYAVRLVYQCWSSSAVHRPFSPSGKLGSRL